MALFSSFFFFFFFFPFFFGPFVVLIFSDESSRNMRRNIVLNFTPRRGRPQRPAHERYFAVNSILDCLRMSKAAESI